MKTEPMEKHLEHNVAQKPSDTLNWTNPDFDTSFMDPPPSKSKFGGISVGRNYSVMRSGIKKGLPLGFICYTV